MVTVWPLLFFPVDQGWQSIRSKKLAHLRQKLTTEFEFDGIVDDAPVVPDIMPWSDFGSMKLPADAVGQDSHFEADEGSSGFNDLQRCQNTKVPD